MKVDQAIYGEVRGGHALRMASDRSGMPSELTSRLDLPDTAPPGADWSPFLSGFPHGDRYVLARTFADPAATRAGMVLSHALIAPLKEISITADLRPLVALLLAGPPAPEALESCDVQPSTETPPDAIELVPAAEALTARGIGPVVRIGHRGFEELVVALWFHLWPELRACFAFRLSFGPQDLVETPMPALICTPTALVARWFGRRIIGPAPSKVSRAAAILSGGVEAQPVFRFASDIGARLHDLVDLPLLDRAHELASLSAPSLEDCVATLRLVERLSPDPAVGVLGKAQLLERLTSGLPTAAVREVLLLRNLSTSGLPAANAMWSTVESWAATNDFAPAEDTVMLSAIDYAISTSAAVAPWRAAMLGGMATASCSKSSPFPAAFWRWAAARPVTLAALVAQLPDNCDLEARLCEAAPRELDRSAGDAVMVLALSKRWLRLHGVAVGATFAPHEAVRRQLSVDADLADLEGVRAAMRRAAPPQALAIALDLPDPRVLSISAEEVARKPQLLRDLDFGGAPAQEVWTRALAINRNAWQGPKDPQRAFAVVIQNLLDGAPASAELIAALATTPVADLSDQARRSEVWQRVADPARANLLRATAIGWLERASVGPVAYELDSQLEAAVLAGDQLDRKLHRLVTTHPGAAFRIITALPSYDQSRFLGVFGDFSSVPQPMMAADAETLGRLVLKRDWQRVVKQLVNNARSGREDVKPALRVCSKMLNLFTRWALGLSSVSHDERWLLLEELVADLYPNGPDDNELWDRAGGRNADLQSHGSGRARWRHAIGQIRRGNGPQPVRLLGEMKRDFPFNDQVRQLANDVDFWGSPTKRSTRDG